MVFLDTVGAADNTCRLSKIWAAFVAVVVRETRPTLGLRLIDSDSTFTGIGGVRPHTSMRCDLEASTVL